VKHDTLAHVRDICLALPEAHEKEAWGTPTFRVRDKLFVMYTDNHHNDGRVTLWCNATHEVQEQLVKANPECFFVPPYVGPKGWVGVYLDRGLEWSVVADLVREAYRKTAPKRLRAVLDAS
jgi:hypothetical protein